MTCSNYMCHSIDQVSSQY